MEAEIYKKNNTEVRGFFSSLTGMKEKLTVFTFFLFSFSSLTNKLTVVYANLLLHRSTVLANTHHFPLQAYLDAKLATARR